MKKINYVLDKAPFWKIFFWTLLICTTIFYALIALGSAGQPDPPRAIHNWKIAVSLTVGGMLSLVMTSMVWMARTSQKFWEAAAALEEKIKAATVKDDLRKLYKEDFQALHKKAGGGPHFSELRRLLTIIETKIEYLPGPPAPKADVI